MTTQKLSTDLSGGEMLKINELFKEDPLDNKRDSMADYIKVNKSTAMSTNNPFYSTIPNSRQSELVKRNQIQKSMEDSPGLKGNIMRSVPRFTPHSGSRALSIEKKLSNLQSSFNFG